MAPTNSTPPGWSYQPWSPTGHKSQFNDHDVPQPDNAEFDINGSVEVQSICVLDFIRKSTGEFCRLGQCSLDWATAALGEAD